MLEATRVSILRADMLEQPGCAVPLRKPCVLLLHIRGAGFKAAGFQWGLWGLGLIGCRV